MHFEDDSPISYLNQTIPHITFEVDNLDVTPEGKDMNREISTPSSGISVAIIVENSALIEHLEFIK